MPILEEISELCICQHVSSRTMAWRTILAMLLTAVVGWVSPSAVANEVIVYSARSHYDQEPAFEAFTKQTGIVMKTFGGNAGELFERLRAEGDKTPADILISVDAGNLWHAAQAGF